MIPADGASTAHAPPATRYWYMDSLRAVLIFGGILFHAALPYRSTGTWNVVDVDRNAAFDYISDTISSFRMPAFFFVAGFFCALTFANRGAASNLRRRLVVFGVPFVACAVTIQPVQFALRSSREGPRHLLADIQMARFWSAYIESGAFVSHLWFLINLIVYYCLIYLLLRALESGGRGKIDLGGWSSAIPVRLLSSKTAISVLSTVAVLPAYGALSRLPQIPGYGFEDLALYAPFFLVGYLCFVDERAMGAMVQVGLLDVLLLATGVAVVQSGGVTHRVTAEVFGLWLFYQAAWTLGMWVLSAFRRWLDVESAPMRAVSDASYTIYLFHHLIVVVIATALLPVHVPGAPVIKYLLVVLATFLLTLLLHRCVIHRFKWLSYAFNGR